MMQVYQLTLSPANMGSPRRVSVLKANIRKMQVCCHLYSKHKTRPLIIPCVQSCVFLKLRPGQLPMLGGCRNTPLPAPFAYRETAAPAFLYRHAPFLLSVALFQELQNVRALLQAGVHVQVVGMVCISLFHSNRQSRQRLDRHGTIVVGSCETFHHYNVQGVK